MDAAVVVLIGGTVSAILLGWALDERSARKRAEKYAADLTAQSMYPSPQPQTQASYTLYCVGAEGLNTLKSGIGSRFYAEDGMLWIEAHNRESVFAIPVSKVNHLEIGPRVNVETSQEGD